MKKNEKAVIRYDSDEAAKKVSNISGWVDRHGRFQGDDEHFARWSGCTHVQCSVDGCETLVSKNSYTVCDDHREQRRIERYFEKEVGEWDGVCPVYCDALDRYFQDNQDLNDFIEENEIDPTEMRLLICDPNDWASLEDDYFTEGHHEDCEVPPELRSAIDQLNKVVKNLNDLGEGMSWSPSKYRFEYKVQS